MTDLQGIRDYILASLGDARYMAETGSPSLANAIYRHVDRVMAPYTRAAERAAMATCIEFTSLDDDWEPPALVPVRFFHQAAWKEVGIDHAP